ncbi:MAG: protein kinase, partial [Planctomycetota bacterium]
MRPSFASVRSSSGPIVPLHRTAQPNPTAITLDDWKLVALLGESEASRVYAAAPSSQQAADPAACDYAVKQIVHPDEAMLARFRREIALGKSLSHPHLMPTLAANTEHETPYLVMPRVHGCGLHTILDQHGPCSIGRTLWIARQL